MTVSPELTTSAAAAGDLFEQESLCYCDDLSRVFEEEEHAYNSISSSDSTGPIEVELATTGNEDFEMLVKGELLECDGDDIQPVSKMIFESAPELVEIPDCSASSESSLSDSSLVSLADTRTKPSNLINTKVGSAKVNDTSSKTPPRTAATASVQKPPKRRNRKKTMILLPEFFRPGPYSVLCGHGKENYHAVGNCRFRTTVQMFLGQYIEAKDNQAEKSAIVDKVMQVLYESCPVGAFVTKKGGRWYQVDKRTAREKVGAFFRDCLADHYESSAKNKVAKRKMDRRASKMSQSQECD